jgi:hypothetical protein
MIGTHPSMRTSIKVRTEVRTLLRETCANSASGYHASYHGELPVQAVASRRFPMWFPRYCIGFHWQPVARALPPRMSSE